MRQFIQKWRLKSRETVHVAQYSATFQAEILSQSSCHTYNDKEIISDIRCRVSISQIETEFFIFQILEFENLLKFVNILNQSEEPASSKNYLKVSINTMK